MSEPYDPENVLDRLSSERALERHYDHLAAREREVVASRLGIDRGGVLSVGCGWWPGRHLFPAPAWHMTATDLDPHKVQVAVEERGADAGFPGTAGELGLAPGSFDVVYYRLVLHHVAFQGPLGPCFTEAAAALRPGGALVAVEPNLWHPVGSALAAVNRLGLGPWAHGTPDDIPLSPRVLAREARSAGVRPEIHALTFGWCRLPVGAQRALEPLDRAGSRRLLRRLGHTSMLIARKPG